MTTPDPAPGGSARAPGYAVPGVRLRGVVAALPGRRVDNDAFLDRFGAEAIADAARMLGVETRYWAEPGQTTADLCLVAAERLLDRLGWAPDSVDALLFVSQTPDQRLPATACLLHARLGLSHHCQAMDVALGCSGYVYGLWLASALLQAGCRRVLLLAGDTSSRLLDPQDRGTALLFGDAGSASALEHDPEAGATTFVLGTDGRGGAHLAVPGGGFRREADAPGADYLTMDGGEVFAFTLRAVPRLVRDTLAHAGWAAGEVDAFVLHQANRFMLQHLARKMGAVPDQVPVNIGRYGNTSSATLPLVLGDDLAQRLRRAPARLALVGFGVGYSWGAALMETAPLACAEVVSL